MQKNYRLDHRSGRGGGDWRGSSQIPSFPKSQQRIACRIADEGGVGGAAAECNVDETPYSDAEVGRWCGSFSRFLAWSYPKKGNTMQELTITIYEMSYDLGADGVLLDWKGSAQRGALGCLFRGDPGVATVSG